MKRDKHLSLKSERWNKKSEQSYFLLPIANRLFNVFFSGSLIIYVKQEKPSSNISNVKKNRTVIEFDLLGIYSQSIVGFYKINPTMHLAYTSSLKVLTHTSKHFHI